MFKALIEKSEEKRFCSHFRETLITFYSNTTTYLFSKDISYRYKKHKDGRPLEKYEELVIALMHQAEKIVKIKDEESISFFANVLYSETILMEKVNQAISKKVPMENAIIKESLYEILLGQEKAFQQYCNINTDLLKMELTISKSLRIRQEETRNELLKDMNNEIID